MENTNYVRWWKEKGVKIINSRTIDLIGQNVGYIPIENLLTDEELSEVGKDDLPKLIETMCDDGMKVKELIYKDDSRRLYFFID